MKNIIKKIFSPRNLGAVIAILIVTGATALAQIPAYKSWLQQGTNLFTTGTNVGINTQTPAEKLDVAGTIQTAGFKMPTGASDKRVLTSDASGVGTWQPPAPGGGIGGGGTKDKIAKFTTPVTIGDSVIVETAFGDIGIGVAAPLNRLSVLGSADVSGKLGIGISVPLVNQLEVRGKAAIGATYAGIAAPANGLIVEGDVGIGLQTPAAKLHIEQSGTGDALLVDDSPNDLTRFVINNSGDVGIGTIGPLAKLHIEQSGTANAFRVDDQFFFDPTPFVIDDSGKVGIGTSLPAERLDLDGGNIKMGYEIVFAVGSKTVDVTCPAGPNPPATQKRVIGGGCSSLAGISSNFPISDTKWSCTHAEIGISVPVTAYAICANIR